MSAVGYTCKLPDMQVQVLSCLTVLLEVPSHLLAITVSIPGSDAAGICSTEQVGLMAFVMV